MKDTAMTGQIKKRIDVIKEIVNRGEWQDGDSERIYNLDVETEQDFKACVRAMKPDHEYFGLKGNTDKRFVDSAVLTPTGSNGAGVNFAFCPELVIEFPKEVKDDVAIWIRFLSERHTYDSIAAHELCHILMHGQVRKVTPVFRGLWLAELLKTPKPENLKSLYFEYRANDEKKWVEYG